MDFENFDDISNPKYLEPYEIPLIKATAESLSGYGTLVESYDKEELVKVPWPLPGPRKLQPGAGVVGTEADDTGCYVQQDGTCVFINKANPKRLLKVGRLEPNRDKDKQRMLIRAVNYHPEAGQIFYPKDKTPFIAILGLPGDDLKLSDLKAFYFDGTIGVQILPSVWHKSMYPLGESVEFIGKKSDMHASVFCDLPGEFQRYVAMPMQHI